MEATRKFVEAKFNMFGFLWFCTLLVLNVLHATLKAKLTNDRKTRIYTCRDSTASMASLEKHMIVDLNQCPFSGLRTFAYVLRLGIETGHDFYILAKGSNPINSALLETELSGFKNLNIPWEVIVINASKVRVETVTKRVFRIISTEKPTAILVHRAFANYLLGHTRAIMHREEAGIKTTDTRSIWSILSTERDWYGFYNVGQGVSSISSPRYRPCLTLLPNSQHRRKTRRNEVLLFFEIDEHLGSDFAFYPKKRLVIVQTYAFLDRFLSVFGSFRYTEIVEKQSCVQVDHSLNTEIN
jgi:hypothetical protein